MKKLLIATSAVVGLGVVSADFASAQMETSFSGLVKIRAQKGAGDTDTAKIVVNRAQLQWDASATSDSGLTYGARIRTRPEAANGGRHLTYIYFGGGFGKVTLGNQYGVSGGSMYGGVGVVSSGSSGLDGGFLNGEKAAGAVAGLPSPVANGDWGRFTGVGYSSPDFGGVSVHADLSIDDGTEDNGGVKGHNALGVGYNGAIGDGSLNAGVTFWKESLDDTALNTASTLNDNKNIQLYANGSFGPVSVGLNYIDQGDSGATKAAAAGGLKGDQKSIQIAAGYSFGAGSVSLGYGRASATQYNADVTNATHKDTSSTIVLSAAYTVAPGWKVYGDYYRFNSKDGATSASNSSNAWLLGSDVSF